MTNNTESLSSGHDYLAIPFAVEIHVRQKSRTPRKHVWFDFFVDVIALGAIIFGAMIILGIVCTLVGAG